MPGLYSPNVPTIRTAGSPYLGGNVAVNGTDWAAGIGEMAMRVGNDLFSNQRERRESDARVALLEAQRDNASAEAKDQIDVTNSRITGRNAILELFNQVGPVPDENTPPEEGQRWSMRAADASQAVIAGIANGTIDAPEAVATMALLFNAPNGGPSDLDEPGRRRGNYGIDLADGSVSESNVFSEQEGADRFATDQETDIRQSQIGAGATVRAAEIGAASRERIATANRESGGTGGRSNVQNQGRALSAAQRAFMIANNRPSETQLQAMDQRTAREERRITAQLLSDNQVAIGRLADAYSAPTYNAAEFTNFARALAQNPNAPTPAIFQGRGDAPAGGTPPAPSATGGGGGRSPPAASARNAPTGRIPGPSHDEQGRPNVGIDDEGNMVYIPTGEIIRPAAQRR